MRFPILCCLGDFASVVKYFNSGMERLCGAGSAYIFSVECA